MFNSKQKVSFIIILILVVSSVIKFYAATQLAYLGDEPDDFGNISIDINSIDTFFNGIQSAEQSRLPHLITIPFITLTQNNQLLMARMVSLLAFNGFLVTVYFLLRLHLSRVRALFGLILIASSSYMFSYSFLAMTSSGSLYLFLSTLAMYLYLRQTKMSTINSSSNLTLLGVVFGLAMAAKLFGVILLIIVVVYDLIKNKQWRCAVSKTDLNKFINNWNFKIILIFYCTWIIINILLVPPLSKLSLVTMIFPIIIACFIYTSLQYKFYFDSFVRWVYVLLVAGMALIMFSPIYLNINNVFRIFNWSKEWNQANIIVNPSIFDPFITIGVKLGVFASILLSLVFVLILKSKQLSKMLNQYGLLFLVFGVFLIIFMFVTNYFAWYPLVIFWILYIPFCYVLPKSINVKFNNIVLSFIILIIPIYEAYRYFSLFPNAQTDGAQYGEQYIGWNKPGFITFEALPLLKNYVSSGELSRDTIIADCELIPEHLDRYKKYVIKTINYYLFQEKIYNFSCSEDRNKTDYKYVMTTNYTSDIFINKIKNSHKQKKNFYVNKVNVATIWIKN